MARIAIIENGVAVNVIEAEPGWKPEGDERLYVETSHGGPGEAYDPKSGFERDRVHRDNPPEPVEEKPTIEAQLSEMRAEIEILKSASAKAI